MFSPAGTRLSGRRGLVPAGLAVSLGPLPPLVVFLRLRGRQEVREGLRWAQPLARQAVMDEPSRGAAVPGGSC